MKGRYDTEFLSRRDQIAPLTGIRIFAALAVLMYHFTTHNTLPAIFRPLSIGFVGVNLFFVLSGFILVFNYYAKQIPTREFYWHRMIRIYPTYLLALFISLYFIPAANTLGISQFFYEAFLVHAWIFGAACGINCPDWSISAEAFFYAVFPLLLMMAEKRSVRTLFLLSVSAWLIALLPGLYVAHLETELGGAAVAELFNFVVYHPVLNLSQFFMGVMAGVCFLRHPEFFLRHNRVIFYMIVVLMVAVLLWVEFIPPASEVFLRLGLLSPLFALIVLYAASARGILTTFLSLSPIVLLGEASYAVYLYQTAAGRALTPLFQQFIPIPEIAAMLSLCGLLALSVISYRLFEKPTRYWLRNVSRPWFLVMAKP